MRASDFRQSYLNAAELRRLLDEAQADALTVTVANVTEVRLEKPKLVLNWSEDMRALVLNRGNLNTMIDAFGDDTDGWHAQRLNLWLEPTEKDGVATEGIRLGPAPAPAPAPKPAPPAKPQAPAEGVSTPPHQTRRGVRMPPPVQRRAPAAPPEDE